MGGGAPRRGRSSSASCPPLAIALSIFQMLQYWNGVMPMADLTWDQYRAVFLRWR